MKCKARSKSESASALWSRHHAEWRDTAQVASQWADAGNIDAELLRGNVRGAFWDVIERLGVTLIVSREYEHLLLALSVVDGSPHVSFFNMPHPSGLAVDRQRGVVHVASTRNPNQVYELMPATGVMSRLDVRLDFAAPRALVPVSSHFFPGCMYMHDLSMVGGVLHANAVGQNAVVRLDSAGSYERVWWPRCIETEDGPVFGQNHIQLNSIAAGTDIASSFFSASSERMSSRRPGHRNYPVDGQGVIFSGATREAVVRGLTRPHSARLHRGQIFVDNSGYGELGYGAGEKIEVVARLPGWTRGLCLIDNVAFVGTSRIIPRFCQYAPGVDVNKSVCGIHAVDIESGRALGSLTWPVGNQIFSIEWVPGSFSPGFPFSLSRRSQREKLLFYAFTTSNTEGMS
jgi:uncharacterized protein (TIGR03032 family)